VKCNIVLSTALALTEETVKAVPIGVPAGIIIELAFPHFKTIVFSPQVLQLGSKLL